MNEKRLESIASPRTAARIHRPTAQVQGEAAIKRLRAIASPAIVRAIKASVQGGRPVRLARPQANTRKGTIGGH